MSSAEADLDELFTSFSRRAWRWECQGTYRQPGEVEPWRRWREGEHDDLEWLRPWLLNVETATNRGRYFQRVRVFSEPPTEYQRWQIDVSPANIAAGEELRMLTESRAGALGLPHQDFWIFDDQRVALMYFEDEQFVGHRILTEPDEVERYRQYKALAWRHAVAFAEYLREPTLRSL